MTSDEIEKELAVHSLPNIEVVKHWGRQEFAEHWRMCFHVCETLDRRTALIRRLRDERDEARNKALDEAAAKIHWLWNADGTKGERRVAAETIAAILALKTQEPSP